MLNVAKNKHDKKLDTDAAVKNTLRSIQHFPLATCNPIHRLVVVHLFHCDIFIAN